MRLSLTKRIKENYNYMNKLILFFILLSTSSVNAQDYNPLVKEGAIWVISYIDDYGIDNYNAFKIESDTIVNNISYQKVYNSQVEPISGQTEFRFINKSLFGLIRETGKQVFLIKNENYIFLSGDCPLGEESLIYDFNLEIGDTIDLCNTMYFEDDPLIINEIETRIEFDIVSKIFSYSEFYGDGYLIE